MNTEFFSNLPQYIARIITLLVSIPLHESAHAWASLKLGDPTAKNMGRLSLNPLRHFDPLGCVCMVVMGVGWAKPVPIDPRYYKNRKAGMALSAAAGPASNIAMAFVAMIFYKVALWGYYASNGAGAVYYIALLFMYMVYINVALGIFNLMPVPPFDGSRIFGFFLPDKLYWGVMKYERYIFIGVLALLFLGVLDKPLAAAQSGVFTALDFLTKPVDALAKAAFGVPSTISIQVK